MKKTIGAVMVLILALVLPQLVMAQETIDLGDLYDGDTFQANWVYTWTTTHDCYLFTEDYYRYYNNNWNFIDRYYQSSWDCPGKNAYITVEVVDWNYLIPVYGDTVSPEYKTIQWVIWVGNYGEESEWLVYKNWKWHYMGGGCVNECAPAGEKKCKDANTLQTCGNYDADNCLEWGGDQTCEYGCVYGNCKEAPSEPKGILELIFLFLKSLGG